MNLAIELILPYAMAYAEHAGLDPAEPDLRKDLRQRAEGLPWWGLVLAVKGAVCIRMFCPFLFLGKSCFFEDLSADEKESLLHRLQFTRSLPVKGLFMAAKTLVAIACYGTPRQTRKIGYKA